MFEWLVRDIQHVHGTLEFASGAMPNHRYNQNTMKQPTKIVYCTYMFYINHKHCY